MSIAELLLVVAVLVLVFRGGIRSAEPLWSRGKPLRRDDPIRLILFVLLILLLVGLLVRLLLPFGESAPALDDHLSRFPQSSALQL